MSQYLVSEHRLIPVDPQTLFDLVADPAQHPRIDGSGSVREARPGNPDRLALDAKFSMDMHLRFSYKVLNTVVEFEEGRVIAWRHFWGHRWRYRFEAVEGGTLVTEEWDARPAKARLPLRLMGFPERNRAGMKASLDRLAELATSGR
jgi:uncharacterized protein YndB with AHSA1/START domain